ncbi:hypothetical protein [Hoeflea sp. BAL378]|uniref:hypothetical protein n=1 Tax=Hoeflea sp. BAL378 TaxID=1547437 RepID=UPI00126A5380|nr:hypothetical protein [Hoeflea sp. BAL378]
MSVCAQVEVPIVTTGRTSGARKLQIIETKVIRHVDIQEFEERDAPVALTCGLGEYRFNDGKFFQRAGKRHGPGDNCRMDWFSSSSPLVGRLSYRALHNKLVYEIGETRVVDLTSTIGRIRDNLPLLPPAPVKDMDMALVELQLAEFGELAPTLRAVGEIIYCPVDQPVLVLSRPQTFSGLSYLCVVGSINEVVGRVRRNEGPIGVYSLADLEEARNRATQLGKAGSGSISPNPRDRIVVHDTSLFDLDCLALNAAIFAKIFSNEFYRRRADQPGPEMVKHMLELGMERLSLVDLLHSHLKEFFETGLGDPLIDIAAKIVERPPGDPLWKVATRELIEQRQFMCNRLDSDPIALMVNIHPL